MNSKRNIGLSNRTLILSALHHCDTELRRTHHHQSLHDMGAASSHQMEDTLRLYAVPGSDELEMKRVKRFREGTELKVELVDTEPHIFQLFIQFLYYGKYDDKDDLANHEKIRDSAKAWVLGDYLDAPTFKALAIRGLCDVYLPECKRPYPRSGFGPETIDFCCDHSTPDSSLYRLYLTIAGMFWTHRKIVHITKENEYAWTAVWDTHPHFRNELFGRLSSDTGKKLEWEIPEMRAWALEMESAKK
ncbi:predicted protein [Plenodomus lingam JN3]|uniref:Predicted protein n=1 Tax=Leptosphaeria maculans (strain JN3 / isolate v23.1.3 / race Av1-4-5-6-7-8) TaxID=985895 RepID=E5A8F7_LEPMJ|nr:predicted protein [Plenodomus lingam JN3]CBX99902.1 predicted protein [Plenodomus lingam JN3]